MLEKANAQARSFNAYDRPHDDLREFIARAESADEIVRIKGADWKLEMGTLAEIVNHARPEPPAILFEDVPGYPKGMRLLSGATNSSKRLAITLGLPVPKGPLDVVRAYRDRMKTHRPIAPKTVAKGPVFENVDRDGKVDVLKFPVPFLHEHDGGRYIGTDDLVIMRDPEDNWVNCATYRVMVQDKNHVSVWISPGKHGRQIREKYFTRRQALPGADLLRARSAAVPRRRQRAQVRAVRIRLCRRPSRRAVRDRAERAARPADAGARRDRARRRDDRERHRARKDRSANSPATTRRARASSRWCEVKRVYYRNDPIIGIASPMRPPSDFSFSKCVMKAGMIWDEVERAGLSGVAGVWVHEFGGARMFNVIAIKQAYPGHARQAGLLAAELPVGVLSRTLRRRGRRGRRSDRPVRRDVGDLHALRSRRATSTSCAAPGAGRSIRLLDKASSTNSRAIIDACRPFERLKDFPMVARASPELVQQVKEKFADILGKIGCA